MSTWPLASLDRQRQVEAVGDGLANAIRAYYDNYTDAVRLEPDFIGALELIIRETEMGIDLRDLITETERRINEQGGIESETEGYHSVRTYHDDEED